MEELSSIAQFAFLLAMTGAALEEINSWRDLPKSPVEATLIGVLIGFVYIEVYASGLFMVIGIIRWMLT